MRAMAGLSCRPRSTLYLSFIIAAGTLAAAHYCSRLNHCASSPYSGTEHSWGISLTQDSRDSDFYSGCHSNTSPEIRNISNGKESLIFSMGRNPQYFQWEDIFNIFNGEEILNIFNGKKFLIQAPSGASSLRSEAPRRGAWRNLPCGGR